MAITRKPGGNPVRQAEQAAERFISAVGAPPTVAPAAEPESRRQPAVLRFDRMLLARVDAAARRRGVSRSAWIQFTLSKALDDEADERRGM